MNNLIKTLLLIPSAYGFFAWTFLLLIFWIKPIEVQSLSLDGVLMVSYVLFILLLSTIIFLRKFLEFNVANSKINYSTSRVEVVAFWFSSIVGVFGLFVYISDFSRNFGGYVDFFLIAFSAPLEIRAAAAEETSFGFQVSYLSWISIFMGTVFIVLNKFSFRIRVLIATIVAFEFILNLLFVDRTRPTIILFTCFVGVFVLKMKDIKNPLKFLSILFLAPLVIFFVQALYTGKYDKEDGLFSNLLVYVLGGFGYADLLINQTNPDYIPIRTFYPLSKILEVFGFLRDVPSQILEFKNVPFETNVGTFVEPLISDGGWLYLLLGLPVIVFFVDFLALICLRAFSILQVFFWANLVFLMAISFFVPKYNSLYMYVFAAFGLSFFVIQRLGEHLPAKRGVPM